MTKVLTLAAMKSDTSTDANNDHVGACDASDKNPRPGIHAPESEVRDPCPGTRFSGNPFPGIRFPESVSWNQFAGIRFPESISRKSNFP